jgi:PAS domain-containing protein
MNRAAEALLGVPEADLVGGGLEALATREGGKQLKRALLHCLEDGARTTVALDVTPPGGPATLDLTIFPLREASGEITRLLVTTPATAAPTRRTQPAA